MKKRKVRMFDGINGAMFHSDNITFAHVTSDKDAVVIEHKHIHEQWTHIIEGEMLFTIEGETKLLTRGKAAFMPSNAVHSAKAITECKVIDCFLPVREDFVEMEKQLK